MKKEHAVFLSENLEVISKRDRIFLNNPVIMQGMGLAPIVVAANNLNNALILAAAVILLLIPTRVIAAFFGKFTKPRFRGITYTLTSAVLYVGAAYIIYKIFGDSVQSVGLYLPLLIVEPIIIKRYVYRQNEKIKTALRKGALTTVGFVLVLFISAFIRELLGAGTLFGFRVLENAPFPMAGMVAGGFIVLGVISGVWHRLVNMFKKHVNVEAKRSI